MAPHVFNTWISGALVGGAICLIVGIVIGMLTQMGEVRRLERDNYSRELRYGEFVKQVKRDLK